MYTGIMNWFQKTVVALVCVLSTLSFGVAAVQAQGSETEDEAQTSLSLGQRLRGYILLDVEQNGEAWYIHPDTLRRRYLGRPADAFDVMRFKGLGITDADLARVPKATEDVDESYEQALRERLSGRILLQTEQNGEAWYVDPSNLRRYYLGRPVDAFAIMRERGLGITSDELREIGLEESRTPLNGVARHDSYTLGIDRGVFAIEVITIPNTTYRMITDTADEGDCGANCPAQSLASYAQEHGAQIGMTGTYFCEAGASECVGQENRFSSPVYNSTAQKLVHEGELDTHVGPMFVYDARGLFHFYHRASEFGSSLQEFVTREQSSVKAAIANYPSLMENGEIVVHDEPLDRGMRTHRLTRMGIGTTGNAIFLVLVRRATVRDLAYVFEALGADNALNLDGGASSALYFNNDYVYGPGRDLPNAVLFKRR